jgi:tRNA threonylcarbamoyladenosine biosynthesis protein TsaB
LLILETSGRIGSVAVAHGPSLGPIRRLDEARRHARDLAPAVAELLRGEGWQPRDLDAVIVSRGPGSYTGLRVGIMSAKTLAYATGCRLIAVETFAAIARQAPADVQRLDVLADAQQQKVYFQPFQRPSPSEALFGVAPLRVLPLAEWLVTRDPNAWVTGPALRVHGPRLPGEVNQVATDAWDPRAASLLEIGLERLARDEADDVYALEPLYLRPSSAEEKWHK